ncbi:aldehyde dehydrogenase family protein, partial [archaeon]|nr:aldehyde dehydrogenase family protein [archaeon]
MAYKNYINGKWTSCKSRKTFQSINPANELSLGSFQASDARDVKDAVHAANKALRKWKLVPAPKRAEILYDAARLLKKRKHSFGKLVTQEMGKVLPEGLGDVQEAIDMLELMGGEGRRLYGVTTPSELTEKFCMTLRMPIGVIGMITPWNFPIAIPSWKIAPALVTGNTMVLKPASYTPLCALKFVELLEDAGLPPGVLNLVTGSGSQAGEPLVAGDVAALSFTGSREVGLSIKQKAGLKRVSLELGGKNPIIIMDDADLDLALDGVIWGAFGTTGQRCTAASRVLVHEKVYSQFHSMLVERTSKLKLGNGMDKRTDVGPLVSKRQQENVNRDVQKAKHRPAIGGNATSVKGKGFFYEPTIFTDVKPKDFIAQKEVFGPVLAMLKIKDLKQAIDYA